MYFVTSRILKHYSGNEAQGPGDEKEACQFHLMQVFIPLSPSFCECFDAAAFYVLSVSLTMKDIRGCDFWPPSSRNI